MNFPTTFDEATHHLTSKELAQAGYEVHYGLTTSYADDITKMALEPGIKEFCPNDSDSRFSSRETTEKWLAKGRSTFLLLKRDESDELQLAGYGWAGAGQSSHVPGGETTFAIRIGEAGQGQGLATPFARLIISGSASIYDASNFWLETWQSNAGAVHVYHKIGFVDVDQEDDERPSASGDKVADTRLYMSLDNSLIKRSG